MKIVPINVKALEPYKIWVQFSDGVQGTVDYSSFADKGIFKSWNDLNFFKQVYVRKDDNAICWNDEMDFDSLSIYMKITGKNFEELKNKMD